MSSLKFPSKGRVIIVCLLFLSPSCINYPPPLSTRPVQTEATWFVRLDSFPDGSNASSQYDHPLNWTEPEIAAILERLLVQQETGLLRQHRSLERVFSPDEVAQLTPALHAAFGRAQPHEWASFAFFRPSGTDLLVTSGGLFFKAGELHVVLANDRESIDRYAVDIDLVRKNPLRPVRRMDGLVTFDPDGFVMGATTNWAGKASDPAVEITLDHGRLQAFVTSLTSSAPRTLIDPTSPQPTTPARETPAIKPPALSSTPASDRSVQADDLNARIQRLETHIELLTRRLQKQDASLLKLRKDLDALRAGKKNQALSVPPER